MKTNISFRKKFNRYLLDFDEIATLTASNVLMWFYQIKDAVVMFEFGEISDFIYNRLKSHGYDEIHDIEEERSILFSLSNADDANKDEVARKVLAIILKRLKDHKGLDLAMISLIEMYNEKFNKVKIINHMMRSLRDNIGSRITFNAIKNGEFILISGELNEVDDCQSITVDGIRYSFIELNFGIIKIVDNKGCTIYNNSSLNTNINLADLNTIQKLSLHLSNNDGQEVFKSI